MRDLIIWMALAALALTSGAVGGMAAVYWTQREPASTSLLLDSTKTTGQTTPVDNTLLIETGSGRPKEPGTRDFTIIMRGFMGMRNLICRSDPGFVRSTTWIKEGSQIVVAVEGLRDEQRTVALDCMAY